MGRIAETDRTLHCEDGDSHPIHLTGIVLDGIQRMGGRARQFVGGMGPDR